MFGIEFVAPALLLAVLLDQLGNKELEEHLGFSAVYAIFALVFGLFGTVVGTVNGTVGTTGTSSLKIISPAISSLVAYWVGIAISRLEKAL